MNEITGGLKNAIERGESIEKAKQSFINSGYNPEEVEQAFQELFQLFPNLKNPDKSISYNQSLLNSPTQTSDKSSLQSQLIPSSESAQSQTIQSQSLPKSQYPPLPIISDAEEKKGFSKKWIITIIIFVLLVLVGSAIMGLYWEKISTFIV